MIFRSNLRPGVERWGNLIDAVVCLSPLCSRRSGAPRSSFAHGDAGALAASSSRRPARPDRLVRVPRLAVPPKSSSAAVRWRAVPDLPERLCAAVGAGSGRGGRCGARGAAREASRRCRRPAWRAPVTGVVRGRAGLGLGLGLGFGFGLGSG